MICHVVETKPRGGVRLLFLFIQHLPAELSVGYPAPCGDTAPSFPAAASEPRSPSASAPPPTSGPPPGRTGKYIQNYNGR